MRRLAYLTFVAVVFLPFTALAEDKAAAAKDVREEAFLPECSWSTMSKDEYAQCQKKRETLESLTPKQRAHYLRRTEAPTMTVTEGGGLIRNRALSGRGAKGKGAR